MTPVRNAAVFLFAAMFGSDALSAQDHLENQTNPLAGDQAALTAGTRLFSQTCQACHGGEGRGDRAPALDARMSHGDRDGDVFLNIRNGIAGTGMPSFAQLTNDQTWQLVAYVRSLAGTRPASSTVASGNAAAGRQLFAGKGGCVSCHQVNGSGGVVGPDLSAVGGNTEDNLRQKLLRPDRVLSGTPARGSREPQTQIVKMPDGREIRGVRRNEDSFSLQIVDITGKLHLIDKTKAALRSEDRSLMPVARLTAAELGDVVAYLKSLNGHDLSIPAGVPDGGLTFERLRNAAKEPQNWMTYWGDYQGRHFSSLSQITPANVKNLQASWAVQMPGESVLETTPLVVDGVMYTSGQPGQVLALDARTGRQIWKYERKPKQLSPYRINPYSRGVALLGNRVFLGTLDAALVALDARTGRQLWETQVADTLAGYSITSQPLVVKDKIITGITGGEFGANGFVDAYDPETGKRLWRFNTVPGRGEPGNDTWAGDSWKQGGAPTWLTGSYDPELDTVYWTVGNPGPDIDGDVRAGDNLYSCSVIALDPNTGKLKWHFQFTPNDTHDWDSTEDVVLVDREIRGQMRKLLLHADRNGFVYEIDRVTGKFVGASAFVRQTWNHGFDDNGRPIPIPGSRSAEGGSIPVFPDLGGGTNFQAPSWDSARGLLYVAYRESGQKLYLTPEKYEEGKQYWGGRGVPVADPARAGIRALNPETGKAVWDFPLYRGSTTNGVLATGGGVVFAATAEGNFIALDAARGQALWRFQTGAAMAASPISYSVNGKQFVAVAAGSVLYGFALPE